MNESFILSALFDKRSHSLKTAYFTSLIQISATGTNSPKLTNLHRHIVDVSYNCLVQKYHPVVNAYSLYVPVVPSQEYMALYCRDRLSFIHSVSRPSWSQVYCVSQASDKVTDHMTRYACFRMFQTLSLLLSNLLSHNHKCYISSVNPGLVSHTCDAHVSCVSRVYFRTLPLAENSQSELDIFPGTTVQSREFPNTRLMSLSQHADNRRSINSVRVMRKGRQITIKLVPFLEVRLYLNALNVCLLCHVE